MLKLSFLKVVCDLWLRSTAPVRVLELERLLSVAGEGKHASLLCSRNQFSLRCKSNTPRRWVEAGGLGSSLLFNPRLLLRGLLGSRGRGTQETNGSEENFKGKTKRFKASLASQRPAVFGWSAVFVSN